MQNYPRGIHEGHYRPATVCPSSYLQLLSENVIRIAARKTARLDPFGTTSTSRLSERIRQTTSSPKRKKEPTSRLVEFRSKRYTDPFTYTSPYRLHNTNSFGQKILSEINYFASISVYRPTRNSTIKIKFRDKHSTTTTNNHGPDV